MDEKVPDYFRVQKLMVSGRVIREINRRQFGDQLANGVCFYRVIIKVNGDEVENEILLLTLI